MSIASAVPEFWSAKLLSSLKKAHVFASVLNTDYEGEISAAGDTVHINSVGRPTIAAYTPGTTTITAEELTTAERALVVDQANYFAFKVDDIDKRQAQGDLMAEALVEASYGLRDAAEVYLEALMRAGVASANALGAIAIPTGTATAAYDSMLIPLKVKLDEANVPTEGRFCIIPAWVHGRLLRDDRFVRADAAGSTALAMGNGTVGSAAGFKILLSNNLPLVTGDDYSVIAGHPSATTYAEQINKVEAYRPESKFEDAIKGLHLFGAKVTRPDALATALASIT